MFYMPIIYNLLIYQKIILAQSAPVTDMLSAFARDEIRI